MVTLTSKLFYRTEWSTEPATMRVSIEHAAHLLSGWVRMYGQPESIGTGRGAKFWYRDGQGYNLLVKIDGATVAELRAAYASDRWYLTPRTPDALNERLRMRAETVRSRAA